MIFFPFGNIKFFSHLLLDEMFWIILNAFYIIQIRIAANSSFYTAGGGGGGGLNIIDYPLDCSISSPKI